MFPKGWVPQAQQMHLASRPVQFMSGASHRRRERWTPLHFAGVGAPALGRLGRPRDLSAEKSIRAREGGHTAEPAAGEGSLSAFM